MDFKNFDILGILVWIFIIIFTITLFTSPSIITFMFYRELKRKRNKYKNLLLTLFIIVTSFMIFIILKLFTGESGFESKYETVEIKQKIGGVLICNSQYSADFHTWDYYIDYKYKDIRDSIYDIGSGRYTGVEWKKDEQLIKFNNWLVLRTGGEIKSDKLIIGNIENRLWTEYDFSPASIESYELWLKQKIRSIPCNSDSYAKIEKISGDGSFSVIYYFRKEPNYIPHNIGKRRIYFKIYNETGKPEMVKITEL